MKRTLNLRRSDRDATRASTLSSGEPVDEAVEDEEIPSTSTASTSSSRGKEKKRKTNQIGTNQQQNEVFAFTEEQLSMIENVVQNTVQTIVPDVAQQAAEAAVALAMATKSSMQTQPAAQTLEAECNGFERIGISTTAVMTDVTQANETNEDVFNPAVPANFIKAIQNGEFFDLSKLLPRNLHKVAMSLDEGEFSVSIGPNSELKLAKNQSNKVQIRNIQDWTTAFTCYMKIVVAKFPGKAAELIEYMDTIRNAAQNNNSLAWLVYDFSFRQKAANNKQISWRNIDQQLWLRIFSLNSHQIASDLALFIKGPSQNFPQVQSGGMALCRNFNRGTRCPFPNCQYLHRCSRPDCWGNHPATSCPNGQFTRAKPEQNQFPPPQQNPTQPRFPNRQSSRQGSV